ncbi:hypothetical protein [Streptomyces lydicus]|uniref:hypothetical protein n=1 Tax=Streptomyces lydicus TaxID=47763 RepID=UPI0005242DF7|nr:hypothetical protein [Streptomyces lydicus]MDC7341207.1 hypothetical protein [Streptomyces lydicus]UEG89120.1 hypothetical protein LJ741_00320 [Streptomyces lydicus]
MRKCSVYTYLRFFFEAGVPHTPLWPEHIDSPYGYPCEPERLPISAATRAELVRLSERFQSSIDWKYPQGPSPWSDAEKELFDEQSDAVVKALRGELGDGWKVLDQRLPW